MPPYTITFDAPIPSASELGYFHRYDSRTLVRNLNSAQDGRSPQNFWWDKATGTLMLRPLQLEHNWLNTSAQANYIQRLSTFQSYPGNITNLLVFEAAMHQNADNPFIFHSPISPTAPVAFIDSPEQVPGIVQLENVVGEPGLTTAFPHAAPPGPPVPMVSTTDMKVICWGKNTVARNVPLFLRWWVAADTVGHKTLYDFYVGQFVIRVGPSDVEVYEDLSQNHNRAGPWALKMRHALFSAVSEEAIGTYGNASSARVQGNNGEIRSLLWLPYRRNYVYLESSYGAPATLKCHDFEQSSMQDGVNDWDMVRRANIAVAGLTPGPGAFQIQKLAFVPGTSTFNLEPFTTDYAPTPAPAAAWLYDEKDTPNGSSVAHTVPTVFVSYDFHVNSIDNDCAFTTQIGDGSDLSRTYYATYSVQPGHDPDDGTLFDFTPFLYGVEVRIPNETTNWPIARLSIEDQSLAAPSARIRSARLAAEVNEPGHFSASVMDLGASLLPYYHRQYFPLSFSDTNGHLADPSMWTTRWLGVADAPQTNERRLDAAAPREMEVRGSDFWKWLNDQIMRDNRDWTGVGHITVMQNVMQQGGVSIAGWDGPLPGPTNPDGSWKIDPLALDDPLGGLNIIDPALADGATNGTQPNPYKTIWAPNIAPPDSYGSFMRRIAEVWSGWDFGFHLDGSFYYHRWDYYTASEVLFHKNRPGATGPCYLRGSVIYEPLYPEANVVQFVAVTNGGSLRYSNTYADRGSLLNQNSVNFLGKGKQVIIALPGWASCASLNKGARAYFERARRRRFRVRFRADYSPGLRIGHCFQLEGIAGTWRVQSITAQYERKTWNPADYEGELVELGHDPP
jgi:hypothetical protein